MKMKYILIIILISISSCALFDDYSWVGIPEITTEQEALDFMRRNINYRLDRQDFWQFPKETYEKGSGDCEDMASLLAHLFIYNVGMSNVTLVGNIRKSDGQPHMVVKIADKYYGATSGTVLYNYEETYYTVKVLTYDQYMTIARFYHL